jgi:hypothetical protein
MTFQASHHAPHRTRGISSCNPMVHGSLGSSRKRVRAQVFLWVAMKLSQGVVWADLLGHAGRSLGRPSQGSGADNTGSISSFSAPLYQGLIGWTVSPLYLGLSGLQECVRDLPLAFTDNIHKTFSKADRHLSNSLRTLGSRCSSKRLHQWRTMWALVEMW